MPSKFPPRPDRRRPAGERAKPRAAEPDTRNGGGRAARPPPPGQAPTPAGQAPVRPATTRQPSERFVPRGQSQAPRKRVSDERDAPEDEKKFRPRGPAIEHGGRSRRSTPAAATAWEPQATWYDRHQGSGGDDFYQQAILPAVWKHLRVSTGRRVLDVGCGQGVVGRHLAERQVATVGVDASPSLIDSAKERSTKLERYVVGDATMLHEVLDSTPFDGATAVLALQDLDPLQPVFEGVVSVLKPGARLVIVLTHPCFRIPKRSGWGFDEDAGVQYRRVEAYLSPQRLPIITHPGRPDDGSRSWSFHRPLSEYVTTLGNAGFGVVAIDELCSHRRGTQGRRSGAEDTALREIPLFLVIVASKR
jgi:SAM-dependent methyltransferase